MNSNEMEREKTFLSLLQEAVKKARKNGNMISEEEITELFGPLDLTGEQLGQVRDYLKAAKIGIGEAASYLPFEMSRFSVSKISLALPVSIRLSQVSTAL